MRILITGGAGFIGSHLADHLLEHGYAVRVLDDLLPDVHGRALRPAYLHRDVELIRGDVRDRATTRRALTEVDAVFHFAARVGAGPSMSEIAGYTSTNTLGTALLLELLAERPVQRLVVASSMDIYGEGLYVRRDGRYVQDACRSRAQLQRGEWDPCDEHGETLVPRPTPEWKQPNLASIYALSKYDQERLTLLVGQTYGIPAVALRFFNVYGSRQTLANPYTGVLAQFACRLLNGQPPLIFEDGHQQRDFVHVQDAVYACRLALERPAERVAGRVFNVGSGEGRRIEEMARRLADVIGVDVAPQLTGRYRASDVRHCVADLTQARNELGYEPQVRITEGLVELAESLARDERVRVLAPAAAIAAPAPGRRTRTAGSRG
jgi:dTDP-L-rhamnose 4-epimerase